MFNVTPYTPKIVYINGTQIRLADMLSRDCDTSKLQNEEIEELKLLYTLPLSFNAMEDLVKATQEDKEL